MQQSTSASCHSLPRAPQQLQLLHAATSKRGRSCMSRGILFPRRATSEAMSVITMRVPSFAPHTDMSGEGAVHAMKCVAVTACTHLACLRPCAKSHVRRSACNSSKNGHVHAVTARACKVCLPARGSAYPPQPPPKPHAMAKCKTCPPACDAVSAITNAWSAVPASPCLTLGHPPLPVLPRRSHACARIRRLPTECVTLETKAPPHARQLHSSPTTHDPPAAASAAPGPNDSCRRPGVSRVSTQTTQNCVWGNSPGQASTPALA